MGEYEFLLKLGFFVALGALVLLLLRVFGFRFPGKKKAAKKASRKGRKKSAKKAEKEVFYQQAAYVDDGDGNTEWQDNDMYAMKEGKPGKLTAIDDDIKENKKGNQLESWDDY
jgi:hypothetical protein